MTYRLGVDVGGTFTDFLLLNEDTGETKTAKVPSTPEDSSIGVLNGVGARAMLVGWTQDQRVHAIVEAADSDFVPR